MVGKHVTKKAGHHPRTWTEQARGAAGWVWDNRKDIKATYNAAKKVYHDNKRKKGLPPSESYMRSRHNKTQSKDVSNWQGASTRGAAAVTKGNKAIIKKKKHIKVPKKLRLQIQEINEAAKIHGSYRAIGYGGITLPPTGLQQVATMGNGLGTNATLAQPFGDQFAFNAEAWLHMISVLFNGKADGNGSANARSYIATGSFLLKPGLSGSAGNLGVSGATGAGSGLKFHVKKSWEAYLMKNLSQRTIEVDIYECAPKQMGAEYGGAGPDNGGPRVNPVPLVVNVCQAFENGYQEQIAMGTRVDNNTSLNYGMTPNMPGFTKLFKTTKTSVVLEPGQTHSYYMRGPSDIDVAVDKLYMPTGGTGARALFGVQKYSRAAMFVVKNDLILGTGATLVADNVGRYGVSSTNVYGVLGIERTQFASFDMPEQAGMIVQNSATVGATTLYNNYRRPVVFETVYAAGTGSSYVRFDEENPAVVETI